MKKLWIVLCAALPLVAHAPAHGQTLEPGTWAGSVTPPGEQLPMPVTYEVTVKGDTIGITVNAGNHGTFSFREVKLADRVLTFWFEPGPRVDCALTQRDDGTFAGPCRDSEGGTASMVMVPPAKP